MMLDWTQDVLYSSTYRQYPTIRQNISSKPKKKKLKILQRTEQRTRSSTPLTLILLTWTIWWAPNNTSRSQLGLNLTFEELNRPRLCGWLYSVQFYRDLETTNFMTLSLDSFRGGNSCLTEESSFVKTWVFNKWTFIRYVCTSYALETRSVSCRNAVAVTAVKISRVFQFSRHS